MSKQVFGALLAQTVQRHRNGGEGVSELASLVADLSASNLTEREIADAYSEAFDSAELPSPAVEIVGA